MKKIYLILIILLSAVPLLALDMLIIPLEGKTDTLEFTADMNFYFSDPNAEVTQLREPVNAALNVELSPSFSWKIIEGKRYEFLLSQSESFSDTVINVADLDTNVYQYTGVLDLNQKYYWKVKLEGQELWSLSRYFTTYTPPLPKKIKSIALYPQNFADYLWFRTSYESEIDSYLVVYGNDGINFPDTCYSEPLTSEIRAINTNGLYYVRIAGVNASGIGPLSEVLAVTHGYVENPVLIVNGFDRATAGNSYDFIRQHAQAVSSQAYPVMSATNEALTDSLIDATWISSMIYILGEESTADETFSNSEQDVIETYLKMGGKLFVSGAELAWDLGNKGSTADKAFCRNYLKLSYRQDAPNGATGTYYNVHALGDTIFSDLSSFSFDNGSHGTYNVRYPDVFTPQGDAKTFLKYTGCNTGAAGIVYQGMFPGGSSEGKLMVLGFPFETVYPEASRNALMREFFQFAEQGLDVKDTGIPEEHQLLQNYPNPFNPKTAIGYQVSAISNVEITIYDVKGRKLNTLVNRIQPAGSYEILWDATQLSSGLYFAVMKVDGEVLGTQKLSLLK